MHSALGLFHRLPDLIDTLQCRGRAARGEDTIESQVDQLLQGPYGMGRNVESAMEDGLQRPFGSEFPDEFEDLSAAIQVDLAVG